MSAFLDTAGFYTIIRDKDLASKAEQWGSLARCAQYRLAYLKTSQYVAPGTRVLDWGCGNGHFSYFLLQKGFQTEAYSFQAPPEFLASDPRFKHQPGSSADPVSLPYSAGSFDTVFSIGVLEHVHESGGEARRSVSEVERILKPGGQFLIFHLPNRFTWIEFIVRLLNRWTGPSRHAHTRLFTRRSFLALLEGTSFEVLEGGRYNFIPRNSFNLLPKVITNNPAVCRLIDVVDDALAWLFPAFCQNWYFILRKKA